MEKRVDRTCVLAITGEKGNLIKKNVQLEKIHIRSHLGGRKKNHSARPMKGIKLRRRKQVKRRTAKVRTARDCGRSFKKLHLGYRTGGVHPHMKERQW